ncbi:hypothetical protein HYR82_01180 [Candidatus Peregrinibacteria bacterium]|nr:hypothetical protein [Candidatus Peregrinibacteria bacterium]
MQRSCAQCGSPFEIRNDDLAFYEKVSPVFEGQAYAVPPPTHCPDCRAQRRYAFRNERKLYHRACAKTGKNLISIYHSQSPHTIYSPEAWWSDAWDPLQYGRPFDFSRPFFEQFQELYQEVPHIALVNVQCENSDYANQCGWSKNCYMVFVTDFCEDCYYTGYCYSSRNCMDGSGLHDCELCYGSLDCVKCYHLLFCKNCSTSTDCLFCSDCKNCKNCFGCTGLRSKEFCYFNEQLSPEEWKKRINAIKLTEEIIEEYRKEAKTLEMRLPHPHVVMVNCTDCTGNYLSNSKNAIRCFDGKNIEDSKNCAIIPQSAKNAQDMIGGMGEWLYEVFSTGPGIQNCFCIHCWGDVSNLLYCAFCMNGSNNCFGSVGLRKGQYCILNRQYTKEEYEELGPKIIAHMRKNNEWGEFFPASMSPFGYNETIAQEHYPLSEFDASKKGFLWREVREEIPKVEKIVSAKALPALIVDVPDDILNWAIECEATKRPFRVIKQELAFYRTMGLPVPRLHPDERHRRRMALRNPRKLWNRTCAKCGKGIETSYSPERPEIVYCEECYLKEVY